MVFYIALHFWISIQVICGIYTVSHKASASPVRFIGRTLCSICQLVLNIGAGKINLSLREGGTFLRHSQGLNWGDPRISVPLPLIWGHHFWRQTSLHLILDPHYFTWRSRYGAQAYYLAHFIFLTIEHCAESVEIHFAYYAYVKHSNKFTWNVCLLTG